MIQRNQIQTKLNKAIEKCKLIEWDMDSARNTGDSLKYALCNALREKYREEIETCCKLLYK